MSVRSQTNIIKKLKERLENQKAEYLTANRVLARMKSDHKIEKKRLMKIVSDKVKDTPEYLEKESKKPDRIAYKIELKKTEIAELKKKIKTTNKEINKAEKRLVKLKKK